MKVKRIPSFFEVGSVVDGLQLKRPCTSTKVQYFIHSDQENSREASETSVKKQRLPAANLNSADVV